MQGIAHTLEMRYLTDLVFNRLVDTMTAVALDNDWSSQDMIDAVRVTDILVREAQRKKLLREGAGAMEK